MSTLDYALAWLTASRATLDQLAHRILGALSPLGYRGRRRTRRGALSTFQVVQHLRAARAAEMVQLGLARAARGNVYRSTRTAGYRRLARLEQDTTPLWRGWRSAR